MADDKKLNLANAIPEGAELAARSIEQAALEIWNFKIITVEDATVTVGTLVVGAIFLIIGIFLSKLISRRISKKLFKKLNLDRSVQHTIETFSFYFLTVIFTLFAMRMANLPITIFTVVGGALAIGIGFGSQNIVNNFISGIILMIERPVKVGDFVEIDGLFGQIIDIGTRSTQIHTYGNRMYIVPNSSFLEKNVANWTHQNDKFARFTLQVGIAYGSDTRQASELMLKATATEKRVLQDGIRKPEVFFVEFGDNALAMELNYWVMLSHLMDFKGIQSNLRFQINDLFEEAGICIAFPQRDIHIHQPAPLRVELANPTPTN